MVVDTFLDAYYWLMPHSGTPFCIFIIMYFFTSFCFWYFYDRHDRTDLKIQGEHKIPEVSDIAPNVLFNLLVVTPLFAGFMDRFHGYTKSNWTPVTPLEFVLKFALCVVSVDIIFFVTHRICHTKWLYKNVHKRHHELHVPIAFGAVYAHWFEHIFVNVLSSFFGAFFFGNSYITCIWSFVAAFKTCQGHSGYDFSWIGKSWNNHDLHHEHPYCNYGSGALMILDRVFGTLKSRDEIESLQKKNKKL